MNEDEIDSEIKNSFKKDLLDDIETILDDIENPDEFSYDVAFMDLMMKQQKKLQELRLLISELSLVRNSRVNASLADSTGSGTKRKFDDLIRDSFGADPSQFKYLAESDQNFSNLDHVDPIIKPSTEVAINNSELDQFFDEQQLPFEDLAQGTLKTSEIKSEQNSAEKLAIIRLVKESQADSAGSIFHNPLQQNVGRKIQNLPDSSEKNHSNFLKSSHK